MKFSSMIISSLALSLLINGCATGNFNLSNSVQVNPEIPKISEVRSLADISQIGLEWTPISNESIKGYYIYRNNPEDKSDKLSRIQTIHDRYISHYTDKKLKPNTTYIYKISVLASNNQESIPSEQVEVKTLDRPEPVSFLSAVSNLPHLIKLIWRPYNNPVVTSYKIERKEPHENSWTYLTSVNGRLSAEYIDDNLDNSKTYEYRIFAKTEQDVYSYPSQKVSATTKALPDLITELKASHDQPRKITLTWKASENKDISYYKVYSAPISLMFYRYLAKTTDNRFEDVLNSNGTTRYYKVTAVDTDGLESPQQYNPIQGQTLQEPQAPEITSIKRTENGILIQWTQIQKASSYTLIKKGGKKPFVFANLTNTSFLDTDVSPEETYTYRVFALDEFGLESKKSQKAKIDLEN